MSKPLLPHAWPAGAEPRGCSAEHSPRPAPSTPPPTHPTPHPPPSPAEVANVRSKQELLEYLRRRERQGEGYAALGELADAYPAARQDLEALKREGQLLSLPAADPQRKEVFYPVDHRLQLKVDADLQVRGWGAGAALSGRGRQGEDDCWAGQGHQEEAVWERPPGRLCPGEALGEGLGGEAVRERLSAGGRGGPLGGGEGSGSRGWKGRGELLGWLA